MRRLPFVCLLPLLWMMVPAISAQQPLPMPVFVTSLETKPLPPLKPEQHEAAIRQARDEMFAVAEKLRAQHGEKTKEWPLEVWKIFHVAEDARSLATARRDYQASETQLGLDSSVEDFLRGASGNKAMTIAKSAAEAAWIVQITGRRRTEPPGITDNRYFIRFRLSPGASTRDDRFVALAHTYKWNEIISKVLARPKDPSGYIDLEAGSMASYKNCAAAVRAVVEQFIRASVAKNQEQER
ncbi:MAG TPA: hypothetical protein VFV98_11285 [Vicinamibacterales bacterium]|nr:hypothetical protein [Vicinamibacterales bacterium]